jgi:sortase A
MESSTAPVVKVVGTAVVKPSGGVVGGGVLGDGVLGDGDVGEVDERPTAVLAAVPAARSSRRTVLSPRLVALRPDRTEDGYRSVHATLTRSGPRSVLRAVARGLTEALITFGLIAVLFAGYEIWGTTRIVGAHQQELDQQLTRLWAAQPSIAPDESGPPVQPGASGQPVPTKVPKPLAPPPGNALARMYIPRLDKFWVVIEGVDLNDLRYGPGHYPTTAKPGQVGNFAVAGHRIPAMFWDLDLMRSGDPIIVETANVWYVYRVTQVHVTSPNAVEVVAPVPGHPDARPVSAMLTITTCNPKWDNTQRLVVHAELKRQQARSAGRPTELGS